MTLEIGDDIKHLSSGEYYVVSKVKAAFVQCVQWDANQKKIIAAEFPLEEVVKV